MDDLRRATAKFLTDHAVSIITAIVLLLVGAVDSKPALVLYGLIIHGVCFIAFVGFYVTGVVEVEESRLNIKFASMLMAAFWAAVLVLGVRGHWYLAAATIVAAVLMAIHGADSYRKMKRGPI